MMVLDGSFVFWQIQLF